MKNVHVLPTDKPSRKGDIVIWNGLKIWDGTGEPPHHNLNIYITNSEKPKERDWAISPDGFPLIFGYDWQAKWSKEEILKSKKIILTDNKDLIKDGIQEIDDEFLEWFVKNPSCEEVKVETNRIVLDDVNYNFDIVEYKYEIIIPRKNFYCGDEVDYDDKCLEQCKNCNDATGVDYGYLPKEDPKQREVILMNTDTTIDTRKSNQETNFDVHMKVEQMLHLERRISIEKIPYPELVKELAEYYKDIKLVEKQTAVEWLVETIASKHDKSFIEFYKAEIEQAKEIEKQQIGYNEEDLNVAFNAGSSFKELYYTYAKEYIGMKVPSFEKWFAEFKNK